MLAEEVHSSYAKEEEMKPSESAWNNQRFVLEEDSVYLTMETGSC